MHIALRLICCVAPYAVAGLRFGRGPVRIFGVVVQPHDDFSVDQLRELFADPRIDVSVGLVIDGQEAAFFPVLDELDLARQVQEIEDAIASLGARGTEDVLADYHRLAAEQDRDALLPGGDDEKVGDAATDTQADPVVNVAPQEAAAGGEGQDQKAEGSAGDSSAAPAAAPPVDAGAADPAAQTETAAPVDPQQADTPPAGKRSGKK